MFKQLLFVFLILFAVVLTHGPSECFADQSNQSEPTNPYYLYILNYWPQHENVVWSQLGTPMLSAEFGNDAHLQAAIDRLLADFSNSKYIAKAINDIARQCLWGGVQRYGKARELFAYALERWPGDESAIWSQMGLAQSNIVLGDDAATQAATDKLLSDFSGNEHIAMAIYGVAKKYRQYGKYESAEQLYKYILERMPADENAIRSQMGLAILYTETGKDSAAEAAVDKLRNDFADNKYLPIAIHDVARQYLYSKKHQESKGLFQHCLDNWSADENAIWFHMGLAMVSIELDDDAAAEAAIANLTDSSQTALRAMAVHGTAKHCRHFKKYDKARELSKYVLDNWPQDEDTMWSQMCIAVADIDQGDITAATASTAELRRRFSGHIYLSAALTQIAEHYQRIAFQLENEGLNDQAKQHFLKAVEVAEVVVKELPDSVATPKSCICAADCYQKLGEYAKSIEHCQKMVDEYSECPGAWSSLFMVGRNYQELKDTGGISESRADKKTKAAYEQLLEKYPDCKAAKIAKRWLSRHGSK